MSSRAFGPLPATDRAAAPAAAVAVAGALCHLFTNKASEAQLAFLLQSIERGDASATARIAHGILGAIAFPPPAPVGPVASLSSGELKVLRLIARGETNREIADAMRRSVHTVDAQVKSVYRKLGVRSRTQAIREAMQQGVLSWQPGGDDGMAALRPC